MTSCPPTTAHLAPLRVRLGRVHAVVVRGAEAEQHAQLLAGPEGGGGDLGARHHGLHDAVGAWRRQELYSSINKGQDQGGEGRLSIAENLRSSREFSFLKYFLHRTGKIINIII